LVLPTLSENCGIQGKGGFVALLGSTHQLLVGCGCHTFASAPVTI
jgi:hypothetical protein